VLLKLAEGWSQAQIASAFTLTPGTVIRIKQRLVKEGLAAALVDKPRPGAPKKFEGELNLALSTLACTDAPAGHRRWTLRLLADRLVELEIVETISHETVRERLKKTN